MRTLVVEDDDNQRRMLVHGLQDLGHEVDAVADGDAGLLAHLRQPYELLVVDWVMPKMDGLSLCQRVRAIPGPDRPYLLVVTGRDRPQDLAAVLDAGADDYLAKPIDETLLQTRVRIAEQRISGQRRHRQAQEALARSEVEFRRVIERCPLGIYAFRDHELVYVNAAGAKALGADRTGLVGRSVVDIVAPTERDTIGRRMERFERTDVPPPPCEAEFTRADGTSMTAWVIPMTRALLDGQRAAFVMFEDITERRAAERKLRLTQFAIDHAADAAMWLCRTGQVLYANQAACSLLGYTSAELQTKTATDLDVTLARGGEAGGWARGKASAVRTLFRTAKGRAVPVEVSSSILTFDGDEFVVVFARDLTERERMAANLQKADRLASVGSLAAGVAHEINNPLAYVISNLEVLHEDLQKEDGAGTDGMRKSVREAIDGVDRVRRIVGDLKSFARSGDDESQAVDIHQVIDAAVDIASNEIRHRAELVRRYGEVPPVQGNPGRLTQVFLNLLVNAAHAIDEGEPNQRITVRTREHGQRVMVEVSDTGSGIPADAIDRVFDPFFTTKPMGMGTGLGLSICHGIITALGGEIRVDSSVGEGSSFRVLLPQANAHAEVAMPRPRLGDPGPAPVRRLSILVVDDEPLIGEGIRRALRGHHVEVARGGREAVERCENGDFDLVLCDVMMPDLSGMEVYGKIRISKPEFEAKFVFMTGGAFTPKARDFLDKVQAEHIEKPFSLRELRTLVNRRAETTENHREPLRTTEDH